MYAAAVSPWNSYIINNEISDGCKSVVIALFISSPEPKAQLSLRLTSEGSQGELTGWDSIRLPSVCSSVRPYTLSEHERK